MSNPVHISASSEIVTFLKSSAALFAITLVARILRYSANVLIARNTEVSDFGLYTFFYQLTGYIVVALEIGLPTSIVYVCIRKKIGTNIVASIVFTYLVFAGFLAAALIYALSTSFAFLIDWLGSVTIAFLIIPYCVGLMATNTVMSIIRAKNWNILYNLMLMQTGVVFFTFIVSVHFNYRISLENALLASTLALYTSLTISVALTLTGALIPYQLSVEHARTLFSLGLKNFGHRLISTLAQFIPFLYLMLNSKPVLLGYLGVAVFFMSIFRMVSQSISLLLTAKLSTMEDKQSFQFASTLALLMAGVYVLLVPAVLFLMDEIVEVIYGTRYSNAVLICMLAVFSATLETLISIAIRPFIVATVPNFLRVYSVYFAVVCAMILIILMGTFFTGLSMLTLTGVAMIGGNVVGLILASIFLIYGRRSNDATTSH